MDSDTTNMDNEKMSEESSEKKTSTKRAKTAKKASKKVASPESDVATDVATKVKSSQESSDSPADVNANQNKDRAEGPPPEAMMEFVEIDSIELERIKSKFINLTGYPIRVQCNSKWAQIPADKEVSRVLYAVAFKDKIEGMDIYSHGVNAITGLPDPQEGKYYIVLPEVRFLLPKRRDLVTHGELMYDEQTKRPVGFKNLFCSFDGEENIINFNNKNTD